MKLKNENICKSMKTAKISKGLIIKSWIFIEIEQGIQKM